MAFYVAQMLLWLSLLHKCSFGFLCYIDVSLAFCVTPMFLWLSMLHRCFFGFLCYIYVSLAFYVTYMFLWLFVCVETLELIDIVFI